MTSCKFCGNDGEVGHFPYPGNKCHVKSSADACGNYLAGHRAPLWYVGSASDKAAASVAFAPLNVSQFLEEKVNHPSHYGGEQNPYEVIKVLKAWLTPEEYVGGLKFNIIKYTARAGKKGDAADDLAKAAWYAARLAEFEKERKDG